MLAMLSNSNHRSLVVLIWGHEVGPFYTAPLSIVLVRAYLAVYSLVPNTLLVLSLATMIFWGNRGNIGIIAIPWILLGYKYLFCQSWTRVDTKGSHTPWRERTSATRWQQGQWLFLWSKPAPKILTLRLRNGKPFPTVALESLLGHVIYPGQKVLSSDQIVDLFLSIWMKSSWLPLRCLTHRHIF